MARISFFQDATPPYDGGKVEVFLPLTGTVGEIEAAALVKMKALLIETLTKLDEMGVI